MTPRNLVFRKPALKGLRAMPVQHAQRVRRALDLLAEDPARDDLDIQPLVGREGYRLRVGTWRVLYRLEEDHIAVVAVAPRGDVYKP